MPATDRSRGWRILRGLVVPALLWGGLIFLALREPLDAWLQGEERKDQADMREWVLLANVATDTLP
jgi:hypothetical protein